MAKPCKKLIDFSNDTFINWISTKERLPNDTRTVLVLCEETDLVYSAHFDCELGWNYDTKSYKTFQTPVTKPRVKFWSDYNLPK